MIEHVSFTALVSVLKFATETADGTACLHDNMLTWELNMAEDAFSFAGIDWNCKVGGVISGIQVFSK